MRPEFLCHRFVSGSEFPTFQVVFDQSRRRSLRALDFIGYIPELVFLTLMNLAGEWRCSVHLTVAIVSRFCGSLSVAAALGSLLSAALEPLNADSSSGFAECLLTSDC
ncbi:hypothetical protein AGIG_G15943 [Arapaima gigas]